MSLNLSIKNVPDELAKRLRERAARNHRSLQGELMAILEAACAKTVRSTPVDLLKEVRRLALSTADEATEMIRNVRDGS